MAEPRASPTRTVRLGALAGAAISIVALAALAKSYAGGLLGWYEGGLRPPIEIAIAAEAIAGLALTSLLLLEAPRRTPRAATPECRDAAGGPMAPATR